MIVAARQSHSTHAPSITMTTTDNDAPPPPPVAPLADPIGNLRDRVRRGYGSLGPDALRDALGLHKAIVGPARLDVEEATEALRLFLAGNPLTEGQELALALALRALRPGLVVAAGDIEPLPDRCAPSFPNWSAFTGRLRPHLRAIGRIDGPGAPGSLVPYGTGFLITPELLVTNRHVVHELTLGTGKLAPGRATVNFSWEHQQPLTATIAIQSVHRFDPTGPLDLAVLKLATPWGTQDQCLRFGKALAASDDTLAVVGYPAEASERNPAFVPEVFPHHLGIKRVSPGQVSLRMIGQPIFCHDASTLGGSSGSPVLSLADATILGVHCGGKFLDANEAIDASVAAAWLGVTTP